MKPAVVVVAATLAVLLVVTGRAAGQCPSTCSAFPNNCTSQLDTCNSMCSTSGCASDSSYCGLGCSDVITNGDTESGCESYCEGYCITIDGFQICFAEIAFASELADCKQGCLNAFLIQTCCAVVCPVCVNGGTCDASNPSSICTCPIGFSGTTCSDTSTSCPTPDPCVNGGTCVNSTSGSGYSCNCPSGYNGTYCQQVDDGCASNPCENGGTCTSTSGGGFQCACPLQYSTSSLTCSVEATSCPSTNTACQNNGTCVDTSGTLSCKCPPGVVGTQCQNDLRVCPYVSCENGGTCLEAYNGTGTFLCLCSGGYTGTYCTVAGISGGSNNVGIGVGVAFGLVALIVAVLLAVWFYRRRNNRSAGKGSSAELPMWSGVGNANAPPPSYYANNTTGLSVTNPEKSVVAAKDRTGQTTISEFAIALPGYLQLDYTHDLRVDYQLSNGGGGVIYAGTLMNQSVRENPKLKLKGDQVVIKHVPDRQDMTPRENEQMFEQEISTMAALSMYPTIVTLVGYTSMPRCIIMPLFSSGDLFSLINKPTEPLNALQQAEIALDIAAGMAAVHSIGVVHRDLKTPNCLIERQNRASTEATKQFGPRYKVFITDFGVCRVRESSVAISGQTFLNVFGLSYRYAPPEVFARTMLRQQTGEVPFDEECKADVYAYSICVWETLARQVPWATLKKNDIQERVMAGDRPALGSDVMQSSNDARQNTVRDALYKLVEACWNQEHFRRPLFSTTRSKLDEVITHYVQQLSPKEAQLLNGGGAGSGPFSSSSGSNAGGSSVGSRLPSPVNTTDSNGSAPPVAKKPPPRMGVVPNTASSNSVPAAMSAGRPAPDQALPPKPSKPAPFAPRHSPNVVVVDKLIRFRAKYAYSAAKADELSVEVEQVVVLVLRNQDGWMKVRKEDNPAQEGFVPGNYFDEIKDI